MRLLPLIVLATALACTYENPAFDGGSTGTGAAPVTSTGSTDPDVVTGTATETTSDPATTSTGTTTAVTPETSSSGATSTGDTGSESSGSTGDTSTGEPIELPANATLCNQAGGAWKFSQPQSLGMPVNSNSADLDMWLGANGLTLAWSSSRSGQFDTYRATRSAVGQPFSIDQYAENDDIGLSTDGEDGKLTVSLGISRAYLSTRMPGKPDFRLYVSQFGGQNYGPLVEVPLVFPGYPEIFDPHVPDNDLRIYYTAASAQDRRLVTAARPAGDQPFAAPSDAPFVNVDEAGRIESDPTLPDNELVLIYAREGDSDSELWFAARASIGEPFGPPQPLPDVNSVANEASPHISRDGCELFFARSPVQDPSAWDIYRSELLP